MEKVSNTGRVLMNIRGYGMMRERIKSILQNRGSYTPVGKVEIQQKPIISIVDEAVE